jgi:hypothetical protein
MPINRICGLSRARALLLPLIAAIYMVYMLKSALDFIRGRVSEAGEDEMSAKREKAS